MKYKQKLNVQMSLDLKCIPSESQKV